VSSRYSKRHYEDVARLINESWPVEAADREAEEVVLFSLVSRFADLFAADNPPSGKDCLCHECRGFDRERFLTACGLETKGPYADCPLCGKPTADGHAHQECADHKQALADAQGESQENLEAAGEIYDGVAKGDS